MIPIAENIKIVTPVKTNANEIKRLRLVSICPANNKARNFESMGGKNFEPIEWLKISANKKALNFWQMENQAWVNSSI